ncbi:MAG TPA: hypothetical protein VI485_22235 [Vicinamibacterales bacterium]|nr:hypothetical protein [Vicinamibacterales bacterium]
MQLNRKTVLRVCKDDVWSIGNQALYDLCKRHPKHDVDAEIVAKVWLIGRAYAASVERGRGKANDAALSNDRFYTEAVPRALRVSELDRRLNELSRFEAVDESNVALILDAHAHLVKVFYDLTRKNKRSLASKYLHFHRPSLFFIYDSRAASAIRALGLPRQVIEVPRGSDRTYAHFVSAALGVRKFVSSRFGQALSPRQIDRLLLATHEP